MGIGRCDKTGKDGGGPLACDADEMGVQRGVEGNKKARVPKQGDRTEKGDSMGWRAQARRGRQCVCTSAGETRARKILIRTRWQGCGRENAGYNSN